MIMVESSVSYRNLRTGYSGNENVKRNDNKDGGSKRSLPYRNLTTSHSGNENGKRNDNEDGGIEADNPFKCRHTLPPSLFKRHGGTGMRTGRQRGGSI